jgi:hypothetical protein
VQSCATLLRKGNLLAIAPGGVYEAQLGDHNYELLWRQRLGFAKVAIEAKVVTICIFLLNHHNPTHFPLFYLAHHSDLYTKYSRSFPFIQYLSVLLALALSKNAFASSSYIRRISSEVDYVYRKCHSI